MDSSGMSFSDRDLISRVVDPAGTSDHHAKGSPDRVQLHKDKGDHQQHHKKKREQKKFSEEDPHVDLQA